MGEVTKPQMNIDKTRIKKEMDKTTGHTWYVLHPYNKVLKRVLNKMGKEHNKKFSKWAFTREKDLIQGVKYDIKKYITL